MSKQKGHGRKYQPAVNRGQPGKLSQAYADLFPADARQVYERMRSFDSDYLADHPNVREFVRAYVPGEGFPQHDPDVRFVLVTRMSPDQRVRAFFTYRPTPYPFVGIPDGMDEVDS